MKTKRTKKSLRYRLVLMVAMSIFAILFFPVVRTEANPPHNRLAESSALEQLDRNLENQLFASSLKIVIVFDLNGPEGQILPFGGELANEVSASLKILSSRVQVIDPNRRDQEIRALDLAPQGQTSPAGRARIAKAIGADGFIAGSFGPFKDQIGITLTVWRVVGAGSTTDSQFISMVRGKIPVEKKAQSLLDSPLELLRPTDGVYKAGYAGRGIAECLVCPAPKFPSAPIVRANHGTILAMIVVSSDGRVVKVDILDSPDPELNAPAIANIEAYKFKPAADPDGTPVPIRMPFVLNFRLKD